MDCCSAEHTAVKLLKPRYLLVLWAQQDDGRRLPRRSRLEVRQAVRRACARVPCHLVVLKRPQRPSNLNTDMVKLGPQMQNSENVR